MTDFSPLPLQDYLRLFDLESFDQLVILRASSLRGKHVPNFQPDHSALIVEVGSNADLASILAAVYPTGHAVKALSTDDSVREVTIGTLSGLGDVKALFIPSLGEFTSFESFQEVIAHLRAPEGCPWDREQTHLTLRKHLLEESYEALDALDAQDPSKMREEFGDLLLQIVLHAQIAQEYGEFGMADIIKGINEKIIRRHPHVFGDIEVDGVGQVLQNWESLKAAERKANGETHKGLLDGLPSALPSLSLAQEYQDRAARVGFDWPEIEGVLDKIREEIDEVREAVNDAELMSELGDLLFALVNLARWKKVDAESALREANIRFKRRFAYVEQGARQREVALNQMSLDEMESLWQQAKKAGL